jgi:hypothetical protein
VALWAESDAGWTSWGTVKLAFVPRQPRKLAGSPCAGANVENCG